MLRLLWLIISYFLGSVPFGLVVGRLAKGVDPREAGSRNIGATNVARLCGLPYGLLVLALDIGKGYFPVAVAMGFDDSGPMFWGLAALSAICGHIFSAFLGGKGGKAVATTVGAFLALAPGTLFIAVLACLAVIFFSGYVSLGSLTLVTVLPLLLLLSGEITLCFFALVVMALVFWRHQENIRRLARGEEKSWRKNTEPDGE